MAARSHQAAVHDPPPDATLPNPTAAALALGNGTRDNNNDEGTCPPSVSTATTNTVAVVDQADVQDVERDSSDKKTICGVVTEIENPDTEMGPEDASPSSQQQASQPAAAAANPPSLRVCLNPNPTLGFCVYALRPYEKGDRIYTERTALEATHDSQPQGNRTAYSRYCNMSEVRRNKLHGAFPELAWANGIDPEVAAEARVHIPSGIKAPKGLVVDLDLSAEDHMRMRPDFRETQGDNNGQGYHFATGQPPGATVKAAGAKTKTALSDLFRSFNIGKRGNRNNGDDGRMTRYSSRAGSVASGMSSLSHASRTTNNSQKSRSSKMTTGSKSSSASGSHKNHNGNSSAANDRGLHSALAKRDTLDWFQRYGFSLTPEASFARPKKNHQAAVYLLTNLINHRCTGYQNCHVKPDRGEVSVIAERSIVVGEELTINYHKDNKDFVCLGECCEHKRKERH